MCNEIRAIDFISMIVENVSCEVYNAEIDFIRINKLRDCLFQEGFSYDLGLYDFEELEYDYPNNIKVYSNCIKLNINGSFLREMSRRYTQRNDQSFIKMIELWGK